MIPSIELDDFDDLIDAENDEKVGEDTTWEGPPPKKSKKTQAPPKKEFFQMVKKRKQDLELGLTALRRSLCLMKE